MHDEKDSNIVFSDVSRLTFHLFPLIYVQSVKIVTLYIHIWNIALL